MRKKTILIVGLIVALLVSAVTANAVRRIDEVEIRAGDIKIKGYGGFRPETLPRDHDAPITIYGGGEISSIIEGELPPILHKLIFEFDRHGSVQTKGLPVCTQNDLIATDVKAARRRCGDAIVGKGYGSGITNFPEQKRTAAGSAITLFNGPRKHGNPTVIAHAYIADPGPTYIIVPVEIKRISKGVYGYRTEAEIPCIAGCNVVPLSGNLTIGKKWEFKGKKYSFVNARCETGHLQARGEFTFRKSIDVLEGTFIRPCKVAK